jgi:hypothetical protein
MKGNIQDLWERYGTQQMDCIISPRKGVYYYTWTNEELSENNLYSEASQRVEVYEFANEQRNIISDSTNNPAGLKLKITGKLELLIYGTTNPNQFLRGAVPAGIYVAVKQKASLPKEEAPLQIYPNPFEDTFYFPWQMDLNGGKLLVFDGTGKEVKEVFLSGSNNVSVANLHPGLYLMKFLNSSNEEVYTLKGIKL